MKKLAMLLLVLALCAPSFGAILVYKQSSSMKGFNFNWDKVYSYLDVYADGDANDVEVDTTTLASAQDATAKITGYVVMDVNTNTLLINDLPAIYQVADLNYVTNNADGVAMILVDKKANEYKVIRYTQKAISAADANFVDDANYGHIDASGTNGMHQAVIVLNKKGTPTTKKTLVLLNLEGNLYSYKYTDLNEPNYREEGEYSDQYDRWSQEFGLWAMTGALKKNVDIGLGTKVSVPTSIKGHGSNYIEDETEIEKFMYDPNADDPNSDFRTDDTTTSETELDGTATLSLDKKATQTANEGSLTTAGTVEAIVDALEADGYTRVEPPAIPIFD